MAAAVPMYSHVSAIKVQKRHCAIGQGNST